MSNNPEIEQRKPIWNALSEFYLDTELQQTDYKRITETFVASNLDIEELKAIDLFEVFPVLKGNLLSVAGVWNGFDEKWLYENCTESYQNKNRNMVRLKNRMYHRFLGLMTKNHWRKVEEEMQTLLKTNSDDKS